MLTKTTINPYNLWVAILAAIGAISMAYKLAIISLTVRELNLYIYFNLAPQGEPGYDHTTRIIAALNSVNSAGAVAGWAMCTGSVNIAMFIIGRGVAGGSGVLACVVPMYQAEVLMPETRSAMVAITGVCYANHVAYSLGYSLAGWLGYACSFMLNNSPRAQFSWRFPLAFQCVFPLIFLVGHRFISYSPHWLLFKGQEREAFNIMCELHRTKGDPSNIRAREELVVGVMLMFRNQLLGIYVIANYGVLIYGQLGQGSSITVGTLASCIFLCVLSTEYLKTSNQAGLKAVWCFFMDATQYVYVAEIFPNHLRPAGVALSLASFYITSKITLSVAPIAMDEIGWKFYLVLICPSVVYIILLYFYLPKTKGRTLEEIGALFGDTNIANTLSSAKDQVRAGITPITS
ncbi:major facilitator superfamily domain-containing protein [Aspergillus stella-maris]|uniref:major facilitator superfamily domain-containing protein n=1 Tax=Aspergillus stella-maris TaxID=1810926 RepID=UPI003CCCAB0E